ncbi:MAG: MFS transporter [Chloroflexi bacterium]|nr:MFS transporter [Chloroflexota bacterium]
MSSITTAVSRRLQHSAFVALTVPNFRLYFLTQLVSISGTWMQKVAHGWLVFYLTRSELWLGLVACAAGIPALLLSPFAGVVVDRFSKRQILIFTQSAQMTLAFVLAVLVFADTVQVWHIVLLSFLSGTMDALDAPARQSFIVELVGREYLTSGITLNSIVFNIARIFGPTAAGIALVNWGAGWCFFLNGLSFLAVIAGLIIMDIAHRAPPVRKAGFWQQLSQGLRYSRDHAVIGPILLLSMMSSIFVVNMMTLMPAFADLVLNSPKEGFATLSAAHGLGAVAAGLLVTWLHERFKRGVIVASMCILTPALLFAISITSSLWLSALVIAFIGFSIILQFITMNTIIQTSVPDEFRGRILSLYTLTFFGIAPLGALVLGFVADQIGTTNALALYALLGGILSSIIVRYSPALQQAA